MTLKQSLLASAFSLALAWSAAPASAQDTPAEDDAPVAEPEAEAGPDIDLPAEDPAADDDPPPDAEAEDDPAADADAEGEPAEADAAMPAEDGAGPAGEEDLLSGAPLGEPEVFEIVRDTFADWEVRCLPDETDCFMYQLALDAEESPVVEFSLIRLPGGDEAVAGATAVSPLGTLLPVGLAMQIDEGEARQYEFSFCSQVGCFARFGLTSQSVEAMKRGRVARLQVVSVGAPEQPIALELSLAGFTAAYDSLEVPAP